MTEAVTQTIWVSKGLFEYTWPTYIDETYGKDISGIAVKIALGDRDQPPASTSSDWKDAVDSLEVTPTGISQRVVVILVDDSFTIRGPFWIWVMTPDDPEKPARRGALVLLA